MIDEAIEKNDDPASGFPARGPHVKTRKSLRIARLQLDTGAVGVALAKAGEAEVIAAMSARQKSLFEKPWIRPDNKAVNVTKAARNSRWGILKHDPDAVSGSLTGIQKKSGQRPCI